MGRGRAECTGGGRSYGEGCPGCAGPGVRGEVVLVEWGWGSLHLNASFRDVTPLGPPRVPPRCAQRLCSVAPGDTIFAVSSGHGRCGVAVIRSSGPGSGGALRSLTGSSELPPPRVMALRRIRDPHTAELLDHGLVVWFPGGGEKGGYGGAGGAVSPLRVSVGGALEGSGCPLGVWVCIGVFLDPGRGCWVWGGGSECPSGGSRGSGVGFGCPWGGSRCPVGV